MLVATTTTATRHTPSSRQTGHGMMLVQCWHCVTSCTWLVVSWFLLFTSQDHLNGMRMWRTAAGGGIMLVTAQQTTFQPIRINCGGPRYIDPTTQAVWLADSTTTYNEGNKGRRMNRCGVQSLTIDNLASPSMRTIYCSNRYYRTLGNVLDAPPFQYQIPVSNDASAQYTVRLHFADLVRKCRYLWIVVAVVAVCIAS
jgi:Malectin domain